MDNPFHNNDINKVSQSAKTLNKKLKIKLSNKKKKSDLILKLPQLNNTNNILRLKRKPVLTNNNNKNCDSSSLSSLNNEMISNSISDYNQKTRNYNNFFSIKKKSVLNNDYSFKKNKLLNPKENLTLNNNLNNSNLNKNKNRTIINIYNTSVKNSSKFILLSSNNNTTTLNTLKTNTLVTTNNSNRNSIKHNNTFNNNNINSSFSSISNEPKLFKKSLTKKKIKKKIKKVTIKHSNSVKNNLNYLIQIKNSLYQKQSLNINKKKTKKILNNKIKKEDIFLNFNKIKKKNTIIYRNSIKLMPKININNFIEKNKKNKNNINLNNNNNKKNLNEDENLTKFRNKKRNKIMKELVFLLNDAKINQIKNNFTEKYFNHIRNKYDKYYKYITEKKGNKKLFLYDEFNYSYLNQIKFIYNLNINIFFKIFHYFKIKNNVNLIYAISKFIVNKYHDNYNEIVFFIKYKEYINYNVSNFELKQFSIFNHKYIIDYYKRDIFLTSFEEQKNFEKRVNFIIKKLKFYKNFNFKKNSKRKIHRGLLQKQNSNSQKKTFMLIPISKSTNSIKEEIPKLKYKHIYDNSNTSLNNLFIISNKNSTLIKKNTIKFPFHKMILNKNLVTTTHSSENKNRRNAVAINYNSFLCKYNSKKLHSTKHLQYVKNDKMTKESALYRTVEIKMKMKQKLKSIEDILFFLIEENNKIEFQTIIEKYCVDIDTRDKKLNTFIIRAVQTDNIEIVNYLIEKGAKINLQNIHGNTALHYAILNKNFKIVDLLIKNGANEEIKNKYGFTPYELNNIPFHYNYKNEENDFFNSEDENNLNEKE